ncbi:MAG: NAD(P)H-hydrate dehydratase [Betaproteobacteria bacterium]|nr:NAD(P)H-hydrate dehydratase [Betaproteobacteria bacterium]
MNRLAPIYTAAGIRAIEQAAPVEYGSLMSRAGEVAAAHARRMLEADPQRPGRSVLVVAGPGNNGGDAFEVAVHLKAAYFRVAVVFAGDPDKAAESQPADARRALAKWQAAGGGVAADVPRSQRWDLVIDGLFGIGLTRVLEGRHAGLVAAMNAIAEQGVPVLALDVPSGINGDTGAVMGCAVRATATISFIALKPGLLTLGGPDHCGRLHCDTLGLAPANLLAPPGALLDTSVRDLLPPRPRSFHKGNAGAVAVIGGAEGMVGAAFLAGRAAIKTGAGKVYLGLLAAAEHPGAAAPAFDPLQPELMLRRPADAMATAGVIVAGPGMGQSGAAFSALRAALATECPLVLDADALNLMAGSIALAEHATRRHAPTLLTPHPAEAARLLAVGTADVQRDRIAAACAMADRYNSCVVLKGNGSILAAPAGTGPRPRWWINATGNPGMASAGMGDVLAGIAASLLAQGMRAQAALQLAVWAHGAAADALAARGDGPVGITASEVIDVARRMLNRAA